MYRQILVDTEQTSLQRILWRDDPSEDIKTYELLTLTYGTSPASFIATKVLQQLAVLEAHKFPEGSAVARRDFYVDDFISGANTLAEAVEIRDQVSALLVAGGFKLRKWASNCKSLLDGVRNASTTSYLSWTNLERLKLWASTGILKRAPFSLLGPVITRAKILMQRIWRSNVDWDDPLPSEINAEWNRYIQDLANAREITVPRRIRGDPKEGDSHVEIHGFADASESAYGACIYLRSFNANGTPEVHLVCSKSRVAPIKTLSMPRLELCGAQLLVQLAEKVKKSLEIHI
ncbi:PREDICTED: uncharacterized protein LOC108764535, partial [Trachymyrmex cornetzi]|uniref:uncharacterized protein LOC108764535 n=1 Tax=Trachymyrmex cornetzi TaxID=471704 RepID=UPI00084F60E9